MENTFKVFTRKVAYELRKMGYKCLSVEPNWKNPCYDVYCFENKDGIQEAVKEISTNLNKAREKEI